MNYPNFSCTSLENFRIFSDELDVGDKLPILLLNAQRPSNLKKFDDLVNYVESLPLRPCILGFVETWFRPGETGEISTARRPINIFKMPGYVGEFCSRDRVRRSGGIAVYVREGL